MLSINFNSTYKRKCSVLCNIKSPKYKNIFKYDSDMSEMPFRDICKTRNDSLKLNVYY